MDEPLLQLDEPQLELENHEEDYLGVSDVAGTVLAEVKSGTVEVEFGKRWSKKTERWLEHQILQLEKSRILRKSSAVNDFCTLQEMLKL